MIGHTSCGVKGRRAQRVAPPLTACFLGTGGLPWRGHRAHSFETMHWAAAADGGACPAASGPEALGGSCTVAKLCNGHRLSMPAGGVPAVGEPVFVAVGCTVSKLCNGLQFPTRSGGAPEVWRAGGVAANRTVAKLCNGHRLSMPAGGVPVVGEPVSVAGSCIVAKLCTGPRRLTTGSGGVVAGHEGAGAHRNRRRLQEQWPSDPHGSVDPIRSTATYTLSRPWITSFLQRSPAWVPGSGRHAPGLLAHRATFARPKTQSDRGRPPVPIPSLPAARRFCKGAPQPFWSPPGPGP